jgi:hypothetical protein
VAHYRLGNKFSPHLGSSSERDPHSQSEELVLRIGNWHTARQGRIHDDIRTGYSVNGTVRGKIESITLRQKNDWTEHAGPSRAVSEFRMAFTHLKQSATHGSYGRRRSGRFGCERRDPIRATVHSEAAFEQFSRPEYELSYPFTGIDTTCNLSREKRDRCDDVMRYHTAQSKGTPGMCPTRCALEKSAQCRLRNDSFQCSRRHARKRWRNEPFEFDLEIESKMGALKSGVEIRCLNGLSSREYPVQSPRDWCPSGEDLKGDHIFEASPQ